MIVSNSEVACTFCGSAKTKFSKRQRRVLFENELHSFLFCKECLGYFMFPELTSEQLERMYSRNYIERESDPKILPDMEDRSRFYLLEKYLNSHSYKPTDYFLDYGCGANPETLKIARSKNLTPIGMELAEDVREVAASNTGELVLSREELIHLKVEFSVIFLGDVLEHLTDPQEILNELVGLLRKDGVIISQGPLQGARTLTHTLVGAYSCFTPSIKSTYPPYHVTFAHKKSMVQLFARAKIKVESIYVDEVDWPAPNFRELRLNLNSRDMALFFSKSIDKLIAKINFRYGTRYFMVGKIENR